MAEDIFEYDPENEDKTRGTRLPFGLCKAHGIPIQEWWTPRDAWAALQNGGFVKDVSEEYKKYYLEQKRERDKVARKIRKQRNERKKSQLADPNHNPDKNYVHQNGAIAGATKSKPMNFKEADSGNCNPYYNNGIGYGHNCQTCVAVYVARRQGYDVRALPNLNNRNIMRLSYDTALAYVDSNGKHPAHIAKPKGEKLLTFLDRNIKDGDIFSLEYDNSRYSSSGHIVIAEKVNGNIQIYDPQSNKIYSSAKDISSFMHNTSRHTVMNLTNCRLDETFCDSIMKRR